MLVSGNSAFVDYLGFVEPGKLPLHIIGSVVIAVINSKFNQ